MLTAITGDIVASRKAGEPSKWLEPLKELFNQFGDRPRFWDIFRGDSFQLHVKNEDALRAAILIKATIKKTDVKGLDVRLALGLGEGYAEEMVKESFDEAFVYSGQLLDQLKQRKVHMGFRSPWPKLDNEMNIMMKLATVIMNSWTANTAETAALIFSEEGITQTEIASRLGIAQSTVNDRIKRGAVHEIVEFEQYYRNRILHYPGVD